MDVWEFIVPISHVKQIKLSNVGGRLIIAMEDALSNEAATKACTRLPIELVEKLVIKVSYVIDPKGTSSGQESLRPLLITSK